MKHTKQQAGAMRQHSVGGRTTFEKHGRGHMADIGRKGAATTWTRYHLSPVGQSGWALVDRNTNEVKTFINWIPDRR